MENKGLLFIPDISGFTQFVNHSEIEHSRLIIQELLETLINANQLGLQVSEIEGDAILFYKFGETPELKELYKQVEKMFWDFHRHLNIYERGRFCQCKACISAVNLTLKVITHYGEFTGYNVKNFHKLIGKDVIVAHQLLKNDIEQHEYWLVTKNLLPDRPPADLAQWMQWRTSAKQTEVGEIPFHYTQLSQLKNLMPPEPVVQLELSKKVKMISLSREYETDIITLFHAAGDLRYRHHWQKGLKAVEAIEYILPRVGMRYRFIQEDGQTVIYTSSCSFHPERIEFSETDEEKECSTYYLLEKTGKRSARLTMDYYVKKNLAGQIVFQLTKKKKKEEDLQQSMQNLAVFLKDFRIPAGEDWSEDW
jgi:hypothetical protein